MIPTKWKIWSFLSLIIRIQNSKFSVILYLQQIKKKFIPHKCTQYQFKITTSQVAFTIVNVVLTRSSYFWFIFRFVTSFLMRIFFFVELYFCFFFCRIQKPWSIFIISLYTEKILTLTVSYLLLHIIPFKKRIFWY